MNGSKYHYGVLSMLCDFDGMCSKYYSWYVHVEIVREVDIQNVAQSSKIPLPHFRRDGGRSIYEFARVVIVQIVLTKQ